MTLRPLPPVRPGDVGPPPRAWWAGVAKGAGIVLVVLWHVIVKHYLRIDRYLGVPLPDAWGTLGEQVRSEPATAGWRR